jgi:tetratricopeptide (TPR) repeat protein
MLVKARDNLQWAETAQTDDPHIALTLSQEWMHHGQLDRADRWLRSVRQVDRAVVLKYFIEVDGWVILRFPQAVTLAIRRNKPADAVAELEAYAKTPTGQRNIPVLVALATAHRRMGNLDASEEWIARAGKLAPDSVAVLRARLRLLAARRDFKQICSRMTEYCRKEQPTPLVLTLAASLLADSGAASHLQAAVKFCRRAVAVSPNPMNERLALAAVLLLTGEIDPAEALYRQVHKSDPDNIRALNGLAWTLGVHRKDYKAALPLIDQAAKLAPDNSDVWDTRGVILSNLPDRLGDAREDFEKCLTLTPPDSSRRAKALFQLGRTCHKLTDHAAARKHLKEALRIDAKNRTLTDEQRREIAGMLKSQPTTPRP